GLTSRIWTDRLSSPVSVNAARALPSGLITISRVGVGLRSMVLTFLPVAVSQTYQVFDRSRAISTRAFGAYWTYGSSVMAFNDSSCRSRPVASSRKTTASFVTRTTTGSPSADQPTHGIPWPGGSSRGYSRTFLASASPQIWTTRFPAFFPAQVLHPQATRLP